MFELVQLVVEGVPHRAHILNISASGALVHSLNPLQLGDAVTIRLACTDVAARIVRVVGSRLGVMFTRPITDATLASLLGQPAVRA